MNELKRLARLVVERSSKSSPLINQQDEKSLETKLFNLIKQDAIASDEDAAAALYGHTDLTANYRMLKSRLRKKLFSHLHFLNYPTSKFTTQRIESYHCDSALLEVQCLLDMDEYRIADKQVNQVIEIAKANQLISVLVRALEKKQVINTSIYNQKLYMQTEAELQEYYAIEDAERKADRLFQLTSLELNSGVNRRNEFMPELVKVLESLNDLWESSRSSYIFRLYHLLSIQYLELCGDYSAISEAVAKAEQLLEKGVVHPGWFDHKYNYFIRVYALLQTKQYELGISLASKYLPKFESFTLNWFAFMENYLLLALHSRKYDLAGELMQESLANPHVHKIQDAAKERWELYRRFLLLMHVHIPSQPVANLPQEVLAELVMLPKDKIGFNLSILILETIKSFQIRGIDDYESQAERIRKYISKYLRGEKVERARLFLRLLLVVIKEGLHPAKSKKSGQKLYEKLYQTAPPGDAFAEVEIIPYEHLWELVLKEIVKRSS